MLLRSSRFAMMNRSSFMGISWHTVNQNWIAQHGCKTLGALKEAGAVYVNAIGGAAQFYARAITGVEGVSLMEFGTPEAMWHLRLQEFPGIVTMDAHGNSLHKDIEEQSAQKLELLKS